jgi:hypothetical protein
MVSWSPEGLDRLVSGETSSLGVTLRGSVPGDRIPEGPSAPLFLACLRASG